MPQKTYGNQVPFTDYAWKDLNEIIGQGLSLGLSSYQPTVVTAYDSILAAFKAGNISDLASLIASRAGMTLDYMTVSWNEVYAGADEYGYDLYDVTDLSIGLVVTTTSPGNANSVLGALFFSDWWSNLVRYTNPDSSFASYVLNPCQVGYHWDASSNTCVSNNTCPAGQHWDTATQQCVVDTVNNCPTGYHWDATLNMCILDTACPTGYHWDTIQNKCVANTPTEKKFPWTPILIGVGVVGVAGVAGYYLWRRSKKRKPPPAPAPTLGVNLG